MTIAPRGDGGGGMWDGRAAETDVEAGGRGPGRRIGATGNHGTASAG